MRQKKEMQTKSTKKSGRNREISVIAYLFFFLFLAMIAYYVYFQVVKSEDFINSPYNSLQDLFSDHVVRGEIISSDGYVLAKTETDDNGNESRVYPYGNRFAHVVGYATNGKMGLENQTNFSLLRSHAFFLEQIVNDIKGEKNIGDNVVTTVNCELQNAAYDALGSYDGAVIVMEPSTGKILAMVSKPDFDPNTISANWDEITSGTSSVLVNRATQGQYAPGSVFKIFTALEYYRENPFSYEAYSFRCDGSITYEGQTIRCAGNQKHGEEDLKSSFANSCNSSFVNIGLSLDRDTFEELCDSMLFNQNLPISFESCTSKIAISDDMTDSLMMETAIGQGNTLVSPLHMVLISSAVCNDGVLMMPYLVDHTENYNGIEVKSNSPKEYKTLLGSDEASFLQEYMQAVVEDGTAEKLNGASYDAYGKTGTAQVSDSTSQTNSWFTGYAHRDGCEDIAIAVILENCDTSKTSATSAAKKVFDAYFD
jgi:peptidoglycan glycosyltransferase